MQRLGRQMRDRPLEVRMLEQPRDRIGFGRECRRVRLRRTLGCEAPPDSVALLIQGWTAATLDALRHERAILMASTAQKQS
jgi:hypothetical protein